MRDTRPHAFLVAYGGGHITMVLPVCRKLRENGWRVTLLALTTAANKARDIGEVYIGFSDLMHHAAPNAEFYAEQLCPNPDPAGVVSIEETLAYHGANFAELVECYGAETAWKLWGENSRQAFLPVAFMRRVISEISPDIVITTNSPRTERAAIIAASQLNIPSLCMVDMFALQEVKWIGQPGFANRVAVLNDAVRDMMIAHGRAPHEVVVTGNPAFDAVNAHSSVAAGAALRAKRNWLDGRITILWASSVEPLRHPFTGALGDPELSRNIERQLREFVKTDPRFRLVIRYHPSENVTFIPEPNIEFSGTAEPLHALLHAVDVVVVTASTVGLEAWLAKRPVLSVAGSMFAADAPYPEMGIALGVSSPKELIKLLKEMARKPINFPLPGQLLPTSVAATATDSVVAEINKIAKIQRSV